MKIKTMKHLIDEENRQKIVGKEEGAQEEEVVYEDDFILGVRLKSIDLHISGYHKEGISFIVQLDNLSYLSKYLDSKEHGDIKLKGLHVIDKKDNYEIIKVQHEQDGFTYSYIYEEGSINSTVFMKSIESTYKEIYIRSLIRLVEYLLGLVLNDPTSKESVENMQEEGKAELPIDLKVADEKEGKQSESSVRSRVELKMEESKVSIYYKEDRKCVVLLSKEIEVCLEMQGEDLTLDCNVREVGLYDLHKYPFRDEFKKSGFEMKIPILQMKRGGFAKVRVVMERDSVKTEVKVRYLMIDWVQQRAMRLIDFLMYQVLEIFYPSLFSFSKYLSRENIIKYALSVLNLSDCISHNITLEDTTFNLCSTTNMNKKLSFILENTHVTNGRYLIPKVVNKDRLEYFPLGELESDVWYVKIRNAHIDIIDEDKINEMEFEAGEAASNYKKQASDFFDMEVEIDYLTKMFELSFLYDIVEDIEVFQEEDLLRLKELERENSSKRENNQYLKKTSEGPESQAEMAAHFVMKGTREQLLVNGRYNIRIRAERLVLHQDNELINYFYMISANNITFDDKKDALFLHTYVNSTQGIQMFMDIRVEEFCIKVKDFASKDTSLFTMSINQVSIRLDKKSNYINIIDVESGRLEANFNPDIRVVSEDHIQFMRSSTSSDGQTEPAQQTIRCKMTMYPDYRKEIYLDFFDVRIVLFNFMLRLLSELLTLEPLVEHAGFEDNSISLINIYMNIHNADIVMVSNKAACIAACGRLVSIRGYVLWDIYGLNKHAADHRAAGRKDIRV